MSIKKVKIYPPIGIARIGNADVDDKLDFLERDDYFIGPLIPGRVTPPQNGYKKNGKIKRQAVEFRLFGYDENDKLIGEVTTDVADIEWIVQLGNCKASWFDFNGLKIDPKKRRNAHVTDENRNSLNIISSPKSIIPGSVQPRKFDDGTFTDFQDNQSRKISVYLGEAWAKNEGPLIVLGGMGFSSSPYNTELEHFANNTGWHDDVSDGPVDARVFLKSSNEEIPVVGAWVVCTIPKFAPQLQNYLTLYDTLKQVAIDRGLIANPKTTEFYGDVLPIIQRTLETQWTMGIRAVHDYYVKQVSDPYASEAVKLDFVGRLRSPYGNSPERGNMPLLFDDNYSWDAKGDAGLAINKYQYDHLQRWVNGNFEVGKPLDFENNVTPEGMLIAALENCCGGAFYPGMEVSWSLRDSYAFSEPFRLSREQPTNPSGKLEPGDILKQMAIPWQADFQDCTKETNNRMSPGWWPQQRPSYVIPNNETEPRAWDEGISSSYKEMVNNWSRLGFVIGINGGYYETDRTE